MLTYLFRTHSFDKRKSGHKSSEGGISSFGLPGKGAEGVRAFHRTNEEKILPHTRLGLSDTDILPFK